MKDNRKITEVKQMVWVDSRHELIGGVTISQIPFKHRDNFTHVANDVELNNGHILRGFINWYHFLDVAQDL